MNEQMLRELSERVDQLAKENRWMKRIGASLLLSMGAIAILGADFVVKDDHIILRDPKSGKTRVTIGTNPNTGSAGLQIFDKDGRRRIVLATNADDDSPGLFYFDEQGRGKRQDND